MHPQLSDEQAYELHRFNTAAGQYTPGLYCSLHTSFCIYPPALGGAEFTASSVQVTVYQHPTAANLNNAAVASIPNAEDFDAALVEMRRQLSARFGFTPDPADLLPITGAQAGTIRALSENPRITRPERTQALLRLPNMNQGQAKAKAAELQGAIDSRPLPMGQDLPDNPAALANIT